MLNSPLLSVSSHNHTDTNNGSSNATVSAPSQPPITLSASCSSHSACCRGGNCNKNKNGHEHEHEHGHGHGHGHGHDSNRQTSSRPLSQAPLALLNAKPPHQAHSIITIENTNELRSTVLSRQAPHHNCSSHRCRHHQPANQNSDGWTKINNLNTFLSGLIGNTYLLATIIDCIMTSINPEDRSNHVIPVSWMALSIGGVLGLLATMGPTYAHNKLNTAHQDQHRKKRTEHLSHCQKLLLFADWFSHAGETAGNYAFVADIVTQGKLSALQKLSIYAGSMAMGGLGAVADVRTCRQHF